MFAEDLAVFFDTAEHGTTANDYAEHAFGGSASAPYFMLPTASVQPYVVGMPLVCNGITYKVVETAPDGTGVTTLRLRT